MKKALVIFGIAVVIVAVVALVLYFRRTSSSPSTVSGGDTTVGTLPPVATTSVPTGDQITLQGPAGSTVVKNFYTNAALVSDGTALIEQNDNFSIAYLRATGKFNLSFYGESRTDALVNRDATEAEFLKVLEINQSDACRLSVGEYVTGPAELEVSQTDNLPLSFCPGSTPL